MKFVFLGYDFMLPVAEQLINDGHELIGIISFPCDQVFNFNHNCQILAKHVGATYIESPVNDTHIESFITKGATAFISAGYPHKIPSIDEDKAYGINIHPSYLPHARGAMPVPHIIINEDTEAAGYTIHKLTQQFDAGDILFQQHVFIEENECVERYCAKILASAPSKMTSIMKNIDTSWAQAKEQKHDAASNCTTPNSQMRTLDWSQNVTTIMKTAHAFGRYGCFANIEDRIFNVFACDGWVEKHGLQPGTCITVQNNLAIIAAQNGFIALKEFREEAITTSN